MKPNDPNQTTMRFPCQFPIKAMGHDTDELRSKVLEIVQRHAPDASIEDLKIQPSSNGKYVSVTITVTAHSREQLDAIYTDLTACEQVLMAL